MPGPDDHAENDSLALTRAIDRLGNRKAIGVIGQPHRPPESGFQIAPQRPPVQKHRIGIAHDPGARVGTAGNTDADRAFRTGHRLGGRNQLQHGIDTVLIAAGGRGDPVTGARLAVAIERDDLHLGAAPVYADKHLTHSCSLSPGPKPRRMPRLVACGPID